MKRAWQRPMLHSSHRHRTRKNTHRKHQHHWTALSSLRCALWESCAVRLRKCLSPPIQPGHSNSMHGICSHILLIWCWDVLPSLFPSYMRLHLTGTLLHKQLVALKTQWQACTRCWCLTALPQLPPRCWQAPHGPSPSCWPGGAAWRLTARR